jgi:hypothetical protein
VCVCVCVCVLQSQVHRLMLCCLGCLGPLVGRSWWKVTQDSFLEEDKVPSGWHAHAERCVHRTWYSCDPSQGPTAACHVEKEVGVHRLKRLWWSALTLLSSLRPEPFLFTPSGLPSCWACISRGTDLCPSAASVLDSVARVAELCTATSQVTGLHMWHKCSFDYVAGLCPALVLSRVGSFSDSVQTILMTFSAKKGPCIFSTFRIFIHFS